MQTPRPHTRIVLLLGALALLPVAPASADPDPSLGVLGLPGIDPLPGLTGSVKVAQNTPPQEGAQPAAQGGEGTTASELNMELGLGQETTGQASTGGGEAGGLVDVERQIDIANIVTTAAKGVSTVQEAPAIVTIITAEDMKRRGIRTVLEALQMVPGWSTYAGLWNNLTVPLVRGQAQSVLILHDGVSLFDPLLNAATVDITVPVESIKRIEVVTGPGGVLWGANAYLGIVNIITKDAEDVSGHVEASAGYGGGPGFANDFRAYALAGDTLFGGRLKLFVHASYERFEGPYWTQVGLVAGSPAPQPEGPDFVAGPFTADPRASWLTNFDGKLSSGPFNFYFSWPAGLQHHALSFEGGAVAPNSVNPGFDQQFEIYDRYGILQYKQRFGASERVGVDAKAYYTRYVRSFDPLNAFMPFANSPTTAAIPTGLQFRDLPYVSRIGGSIDSDIVIGAPVRLLVGGEAFNEGVDHTTVTFDAPDAAHLANLPLPCPRTMAGTVVPGCPIPFIFGASRTVMGAYADLQVHPVDVLTLDGGARYQLAPDVLSTAELGGSRGYILPTDVLQLPLLISGAAVVRVLPDVHVKLNYAEGFRPPVFNNTDSNGQAVEFGGNPNLLPETSRALQGEINARLLRNVKHIRELSLRADASYTILQNLIQIINGQYINTGTRGITSAEFLARLYVNGGGGRNHELGFSYTYLKVDSYDPTSPTSEANFGVIRGVPENWFDLDGLFEILPGKLDLTANLYVTGSALDPNRYVGPIVPTTSGATVPVPASSIALDQLPPIAFLNLGVRWHGLLHNHLTIAANVYNALNEQAFWPDALYSLAPHVEWMPMPMPGISAFAHADYQY